MNQGSNPWGGTMKNWELKKMWRDLSELENKYKHEFG